MAAAIQIKLLVITKLIKHRVVKNSLSADLVNHIQMPLIALL